MSPEEIRELWGRFLAGEELSLEAQKSLVDALDRDPELRESLLENLQLDGILHAMSATRRDGEAFVRHLSECLAPERDATRFVKKVESRLNENPPPGTPPATGRKAKKDTTRVFRRRPASSTSGETAWKPALIAAAAFLTILLLVTHSPKGTKPAPRTPAPQIVNHPGTPPAPVPVPPRIPERREKPPTQTVKSEPLREIPRIVPPPPPQAPPKRELTPEERQRIDEELKKKIPQPRPKTEPAPTTTVELAAAPAILERFEPNVYIVKSKSDKRRPSRPNLAIAAGTDVETVGASSLAFLRFSDDTWVEVGPNSSFREDPAVPGKGRQVYLAYGTLESKITRQSPDQPMIFRTPAGEATILGTTIRLTVSHDPKVGTTLEVKEGRVRLRNLLENKTAEVVTGQFAVAAAGAEMKPQKCFPDEVLVKFGPSDVPLKEGWVLDSGEEFDPVRGYGWVGPKDGGPVPGLFWRDPATGKLIPKNYGRLAARRTTDPNADPLRTTDVVAGWAGQSETWRMPVPNGRYLVSVCCGDVSFEQGPHHVNVEGVQVIDQRKNKAGQSVEVLNVPVEVKDGEMTMIVGGNPGKRRSADGSTDTCINYLLIKRVRK